MSRSAEQRPTIEEAAPDHQRDVAAIRAVIADVEISFNKKDPDLSVEHFTRDASVVDVVGARVSSRGALFEANRASLTGPLRDQYARYVIDDIVFLRSDVAIAHIHASATDSIGTPIDVGHGMITLYVLVRDHDRWWIAARQDTAIQA